MNFLTLYKELVKYKLKYIIDNPSIDNINNINNFPVTLKLIRKFDLIQIGRHFKTIKHKIRFLVIKFSTFAWIKAICG